MKSYSKLVGLLFLAFLCSFQSSKSTNYYFNPTLGNDENTGTSISAPFKSLSKIKTLKLNPGDSLLLAVNETFSDGLELKEISGTKKQPIVVSVYGTSFKNDKAIIKTQDALNAILVENSNFIVISHLEVSANPSKNTLQIQKNQMRCGVLVTASQPKQYEHIYLSNLVVKDIFFEQKAHSRSAKETKSANGTQNYGWGIRFITSDAKAILKNIKVTQSLVQNVSHTGIKLTARGENHGILDFEISNNQVFETGGPGIQMSGVKNGHIFNNNVNKSGSTNDSRKWGRGSGLWTWGSENVLIEKNRFTNANGPGDSAGAHIDYNCKNIVLQYNFSANNAGGFAEILGNNHNCSYRYNISVNDGYRVKDVNGAFQEGKLFWLSGYSGKKRIGPVNSYFYNNTMYVKSELDAKIAIDRISKGVLIANNIFHIEGNSKMVKGDQYNPEKEGNWEVTDVFFKNNLFLSNTSWPKESTLQDENPIFGDANFINKNGFDPENFTPRNKELIQNKGVQIPKLANDSIGIIYGLNLKKDILGNDIKGLPDLGAIELMN
ncbi:MAG: right-handed parallel beta-helix repeat-containing protein [Polaribacter sp.]|uniref:right-handed parallel beta-helix repeat-containing protein n=1 Tax=Polaribacter sp. TaxID=1920175 RepID=UPI003BB00CD7